MEFLDASQQAHLAEEQEHAAAQQRELEHAHTLASSRTSRGPKRKLAPPAACG